MKISARHKWPDELRCEISPQKTEYSCPRCGLVKVSRHEREGARDLHWKEFWRDLDRVDQAGETPPCDGRLERAAG